MPIPVMAAIPMAGAALGLGAPALSYMHGKSKGKKDPSKGGLGGAVASGMLLNPLSGMAYGLGHRHGRDEAVDEAMDSFGSGKPVNFTLREQDLKRDKKGRAFIDLMNTNKNVKTLMGGGAQPRFVNQYGGAYNPLAADINQQKIRNVSPNLGAVGYSSPESAPMDYRSARMSMVGQDPNMMYY